MILGELGPYQPAAWASHDDAHPHVTLGARAPGRAGRTGRVARAFERKLCLKQMLEFFALGRGGQGRDGAYKEITQQQKQKRAITYSM